MNVLSRRGFSVLLVALVAFMSLFFAGCASDEEKFIKLSDEFYALKEEASEIELKKYKKGGYDGTKKGALECYRNYPKRVEENEKVVKEIEANYEKQKAVVAKIEPFAKKTMKFKEEVRKIKVWHSLTLDGIQRLRADIEEDKKFMQDPKSFYSRSKATGFTDVPGLHFSK